MFGDAETPTHGATVADARTPAALALTGALDAGDVPEALDIVHTHWGELFYALPGWRLHESLSQLPVDELTGEPGSAMLAHLVNLAPAPEPLAEARGASNDALLVEAMRLATANRPVEALSLVESTPELLTSVPGLGDPSQGRRSARFAIIATIALLAGRLSRARQILREASEVPVADRFPHVNRRVAVLLALTHALEAELEPAQRWLDKAESHPRSSSWAEEQTDSYASLVRLSLAVDRVDVEAVRKELARHSSPMEHHELWSMAIGLHVRALLLLRKPHLAFSTVNETTSHLGSPDDLQGWPHMAVRMVPAQLALSTGAMDEAARYLADPDLPGLDALEALADYVIGDVEGCLRRSRLIRLSAYATPRLLMTTLGLIAACHHARNDADARNEALEAMLTIGRVTGLASPFVQAPMPLRPRLLELDIPQRVRDLLLSSDAPMSPEPMLDSPLTPSEISVLRQLTLGLSRSGIAKSLHLSENTVKTHLRNLYAKLGVSNREQALDRTLELRAVLMRDPR